jgi:hypothetical protein
MAEPDYELALHEHAKYLGIDPIGEPYLLPLAKESLDAPLPADWVESDDGNGNIYYFNESLIFH